VVTTDFLADGRELPLVVRPALPDIDPIAWAAESRSWIQERLLSSGALLMRGFPIDSVEAFNAFVKAVSGEPLEYKERSSPRSQVMGNIYTSTDYPPHYPIFLHNENSYQSHWPMKLFFYCDTPAASGGETPIADSRRITQRIDPGVRRRFAEKHVMYVRNFSQGLGLPWSTVFGSSDRSDVETYCRAAGIRYEWQTGDGLRTRHVRPAFQRHPQTGEEIWFNHATFFNVSTLDPMIRDVLVASYGPEELPSNTFYGDGSPIEPEVLEHLREVYRAETVMFPWQLHDLMLVDNMCVAHGRSPYTGKRKILVAMAEPTGGED
jgi:alpha-ketoglutarate-dependent taurine dioxygenase